MSGNEVPKSVMGAGPLADIETETVPVLTRDAILAADESALLEPLEIPEWGGVIYIRVMSGAERDALEAETQGENKNLANFRARLAVKVAADAAGVRLFKDADAGALGKKNCRSLERIVKAGLDVNAFDGAAVEELEKN